MLFLQDRKDYIMSNTNSWETDACQRDIISRFEEKANELDNTFLEEQLDGFPAVLPHSISGFPKFSGFVKHLAYVILSFLKKETTCSQPQSLFIQIPVEEFANKDSCGEDNDQKRLFETMLGTVATCLAKATLESRLGDILIDGPIDYRGPNNRWYHEGDQFLVLNSGGNGEFLWCGRRNDDGRLILKRKVRIRRDGTETFSFVNDAFIREHQGNIVRILSPGLKPRLNDVSNEYAHLLGFLQMTGGFPLPSYRSAALVSLSSYGIDNETANLPNKYFPLFERFNDIGDLTREAHTDIVVVVGDQKYRDRVNEFNAKAFKKIIYIGSDAPSDGIDVYPFSIREMYRYCAGGRGWGDFALLHQYEAIPFPWLDSTIRGLESLLDEMANDDVYLTKELRRLILNKIRFAFSDIYFNKDKWETRKDGLLTDIDNLLWDCSDDTFAAIEEWVNSTSYESAINPKIRLIEDLLDPDLIVGKMDSFKRDVRNLSDAGNVIVLDAPCDYHLVDPNNANTACNSACRYILANLLFSDIHGLYYSHEGGLAKNLRRYLNRDIALMSSSKRQEYGTDISLPFPAGPDETREEIHLEDYFDSISQMRSWFRSGVETELTFQDGSSARIDGDVLVIERDGYDRVSYVRRAVEDLEIVDGGPAICYYQPPEDFNVWVRMFCRLPEGQSVEDYVNRWKTSFREYVNDSDSDPRQMLMAVSRETGINESILRSHLTGDRYFMRSEKDWSQMTAFLVNHKLISETDAKYLSAARNLWKTNTNFGRQLKDDVFTYRISSVIQTGGFLASIMQGGIPLESILEQCLRENLVRSINIINNYS